MPDQDVVHSIHIRFRRQHGHHLVETIQLNCGPLHHLVVREPAGDIDRLLAEFRVAIALRKPTAFCSVTTA